jgi:hypothetical protein
MGRIIVVGDRNQAIYGFRGSDIEAFESFQDMLMQRSNGCKSFPLTVCRRCPKSHIRLAQSIVPDIQWMTQENSGTDAPEGEIYQVSGNVAVDMMQEGDMGIGRVNKVLIPVAYQLIRMRKGNLFAGSSYVPCGWASPPVPTRRGSEQVHLNRQGSNPQPP